MLRMFFKADEVAHLSYHNDFNDKLRFSIPKDSKLVLTQNQQETLGIEGHNNCASTFAPEVKNQDVGRKVFTIKGDEPSIRELYDVLINSGLKVTYTANGAHQVAENADALIRLIHEEKINNEQSSTYISY